MKKHSRTTRQNALLLTSVSTLVTLAACDFTEMKNPFGSDRPPQVVEGERRQPIYNQQMMSRVQPPAAMSHSAPAVLPPAAPPAVVPPPPVAVMAPEPVQQALPPQPQREILAAHSFTAPGAESFTTSPAPKAAVMPAPVQQVEVPVEPVAPVAEKLPAPAHSGKNESFFSRIFSNHETTGSENLPPWKMREGVQDDYVEPQTASRVEKIEPSVQAENPEAAPAWADQWIGKKPPQPDASMEAERNAPAPSLASVPPRPADFETAKTSSQTTLQQLQDARSSAEADRATLTAEPSQQFKSTTVEMPAEEAASSEAKSYVTPAAVPAAPAPSYPGSSPRRGVDIMTQEQWEALRRGQVPQSQPMPAPDQRGEMEHPERDSGKQASASEPTSFFSRVFGSLNTEHTDTNTPAIPSAQPANIAQDSATLDADSEQQLSLLTPPVGHNSAAAAELSAEMEAEKTAASNPESDWLLALISQSNETERKQNAQPSALVEPQAPQAIAQVLPEPAASPEKQLLAQLSAPPVAEKIKSKSTKVTLSRKSTKAEPVQLSLLPGAQRALPTAAALLQTPLVDNSLADTAPVEIAHLQSPLPTAPKVEASTQEMAALSEPEAKQPSWFSQMLSASSTQLGETPREKTKVKFGTELPTASSAVETPKPEEVAQAPAPEQQPVMELAAVQLPTQQAAPAPQASAPEAPIVNRSVAEHNARLAVAKEAKFAKKKGKTDLAKKEKTATPALAKKQTPDPIQAAKLEAAHKMQQAKDNDAEMQKIPVTLSELPTAPEHMAAVFSPVSDQQAEATLPEPQQTASQQPILQTTPEIAKPQWYNRMFDANGKQVEGINPSSGTVAVNENTDDQKTASPAQNSASPAEAPAEKSVNTAAANDNTESKLPSLSSIAAPVTRVLAGEAGAALAAGAASSLPSPKILQEIKMLPTSRYSSSVRTGPLQDSH